MTVRRVLGALVLGAVVVLAPTVPASAQENPGDGLGVGTPTTPTTPTTPSATPTGNGYGAQVTVTRTGGGSSGTRSTSTSAVTVLPPCHYIPGRTGKDSYEFYEKYGGLPVFNGEAYVKPEGHEEHKDDDVGRYWYGMCDGALFDGDLDAFFAMAEAYFATYPGTVFVAANQTPPVPPVPVTVLRDLAYEARDVPDPVVRHNPAALAVTRLKTWMWADRGSLEPITIRASSGNAFAEVRVTPGGLSLSAPGATPVTCPDAGTPYDTSRPDTAQDTDCQLTFTRSSAGQPGGDTTVTASSTWTAVWFSSLNPAPQPLPATPTGASFALRVAEVQSVVRG